MVEEKLKPEDEITEADTAVARTRPAVLCDAYLLESGDKFFRITFGEGNANTRERIRFAMIMPTDDVRELARMLGELLAKLDNKTEESIAKAAE